MILARKTSILANVHIPDFDGSEMNTVRQHREWRKSVDIMKLLNNLNDTELAMLVYSQVKGRASLPRFWTVATSLPKARWQTHDDAIGKIAHGRLGSGTPQNGTAHAGLLHLRD